MSSLNDSSLHDHGGHATESELSPPELSFSTTTTTTVTTASESSATEVSGMEHTMMESIKNVSSPSTIEHLIESLRHRLRGLSGGGHNGSVGHPEVGGVGDFDLDLDLASHANLTGNFSDDDLKLHSSSSNHDDHSADDDDDGQLVRVDTVLLFSSLIVMIILGLLLRLVCLYFTRIRVTRERYHDSLKQIGTQMNSVTRTISSDPNKTFAQDTPRPKHKVYPMGVSKPTPGLEMKQMKQQQRPLSAQDSMTPTRKQLEARRLSRFQTFAATQD